MNADSDIERNKALVRRFFAAIEHGDFRVFDEIVAEDYDDHLAGQTPGRETLKRYFTGLRSAFADLRLLITNKRLHGLFDPLSGQEQYLRVHAGKASRASVQGVVLPGA